MIGRDPDQIADVMEEDGLVPVFHSDDAGLVARVAGATSDAGARVFEYTNRSVSAPEVFLELRASTDTLLGVGSIATLEQALAYLECGADFLVSAHMDVEIASHCAAEGVLYIPGCGTVTEIAMAERLGARIVKVFPGSVLGPGFIKAVCGPRPWSRLMPTGGVDEANLADWFAAGAACVGMGSKLFTPDAVGSPEELRTRTAALLATIRELRA